MLEIITLLMLILGGLVLSSRAEAVAFNKENPKPYAYIRKEILGKNILIEQKIYVRGLGKWIRNI